MSAPSHQDRLPREGDLAEHPFASLLLGLWREGFTGTLELSRESVEKRVQWHEGVPVFADSNRESESLAQQLVDAERLHPAKRDAVRAYVEERKVAEGVALLALKLLEPKELLLAMREQLRRRLVDCFGWPAGRFVLADGEAPGEDAQALRVDPLQVLQDGLAAHWSADRLLADLGPCLELHARPGARFESIAARLRQHPEVDALLSALDPQRSFGEVVYASGAPERLAAAWILAETGALELSDGPPAAEPLEDTPDGSAAPAGLDIEIEVRGAAADAEPDADDEDGGMLELPSAETEGLRKEVLELHERLDELDHYEVLGVAPEAADGVVKKSYFAHAKRFHPDAISRAGLSDLHREANELFARIAQAYQTLSNPQRRQAYDRSKNDGEPVIDASRVAQAETLYRKGEVLMKVGNFNGALDFLRPCVELWPDEADYQAGLGWSLYKARPSEPEKAREHLELAIEKKPDEPVLLFRLGMVLRKLGEAERGQELLDRSKALEKEAKG